MYIVTQLTQKKEKDIHRQLFDDLDKDTDGILSKADVLEALRESVGPLEEGIKEINLAFASLEQAGYDSLHYSGTPLFNRVEYMAAAVNKPRVLTKANLQTAFRWFTKVDS